jgi:hypothetical protein
MVSDWEQSAAIRVQNSAVTEKSCEIIPDTIWTRSNDFQRRWAAQASTDR